MENNSKAFVFDLDGTLFETIACIQEGDDEFIEFRDATKLLRSSKPLPLLALARRVKREGHMVYILTARACAIAPTIARLLRIYGVEAEYVYCGGDAGTDIPEYKRDILEGLAQEHDRVYFYDDEEPNRILASKIGIRSYDPSGYDDVPF